MSRQVKVAIIGAGFAGLAMAAQLTLRGEHDFVVIETGDDVGGTWRDNTYPGAACDIRSDLYSLSFAPNPDWTRRYGSQSEILDYLRAVADRFGLRQHILFCTRLEHAAWDESARSWVIETSAGTMTSDVLISGAGPLIEPVWPHIEGLESFSGELFHSARWNHAAQLAGKRVAVIGTGASAIQFVPELQKVAAVVTVFQRTPAWIIPRHDRATSARRRALFRRYPALQQVSRSWIFATAEIRFAGFRFGVVGALFRRVALRFLRSQVEDAALRAKLTPRYRIGCKRILISSDFYRAITSANAELVTSEITRVEGDTIVTDDGRREQFDVVVVATGFSATRPPIARHITGAGGVLLADAWSPHMGALRGTAVAGFPNLFLLVGPNTALGHNSIVYIIETQVRYILMALDAMRDAGARTIEATIGAQARYNERLQSELARSVWVTGGCSSYYLDAAGRNTALWPHRAAAFGTALSRFDPREFVLGAPTG